MRSKGCSQIRGGGGRFRSTGQAWVLHVTLVQGQEVQGVTFVDGAALAKPRLRVFEMTSIVQMYAILGSVNILDNILENISDNILENILGNILENIYRYLIHL